MAISVRYFARLREQLGREGDELDASGVGTVRAAWEQANPDAEIPPNTLAAVNQAYAKLDNPVADGDEVAFFPPVTGG